MIIFNKKLKVFYKLESYFIQLILITSLKKNNNLYKTGRKIF
jgi:hypothetical protein